MLNTGSVTVQDGAALAGTGEVDGAVTVEAGGRLVPAGGGTMGVFTINNALHLAGTVVVRLSKAGVALSSDRVTGMSALGYGGSLVVTNIGAGSLAAGDTFSLFTANAYSGAFTNLSLPPLSAGLLWDSSNLVVNGSITVVPASGRACDRQPAP